MLVFLNPVFSYETKMVSSHMLYLIYFPIFFTSIGHVQFTLKFIMPYILFLARSSVYGMWGKYAKKMFAIDDQIFFTSLARYVFLRSY